MKHEFLSGALTWVTQCEHVSQLLTGEGGDPGGLYWGEGRLIGPLSLVVLLVVATERRDLLTLLTEVCRIKGRKIETPRLEKVGPAWRALTFITGPFVCKKWNDVRWFNTALRVQPANPQRLAPPARSLIPVFSYWRTPPLPNLVIFQQ